MMKLNTLLYGTLLGAALLSINAQSSTAMEAKGALIYNQARVEPTARLQLADIQSSALSECHKSYWKKKGDAPYGPLVSKPVENLHMSLNDINEPVSKIKNLLKTSTKTKSEDLSKAHYDLQHIKSASTELLETMKQHISHFQVDAINKDFGKFIVLEISPVFKKKCPNVIQEQIKRHCESRMHVSLFKCVDKSEKEVLFKILNSQYLDIKKIRIHFDSIALSGNYLPCGTVSLAGA